MGTFWLKLLVSLCLPEPGYYQDGEFGIRIEDVFLVVEAKTKVKCKRVGLEVWTAFAQQALWICIGDEGDHRKWTF